MAERRFGVPAWDSAFLHSTPDSLAQGFNRMTIVAPVDARRPGALVSPAEPRLPHWPSSVSPLATLASPLQFVDMTPREALMFQSDLRKGDPMHGSPTRLARYSSLPTLVDTSPGVELPELSPKPAVFAPRPLMRHNSLPSFENLASAYRQSRLALDDQFEPRSEAKPAPRPLERSLSPPPTPPPAFEYVWAMRDKITPSTWQPFPFGQDVFVRKIMQLAVTEQASIRSENIKSAKASESDLGAVVPARVVQIPTAAPERKPKSSAKKKIPAKRPHSRPEASSRVDSPASSPAPAPSALLEKRASAARKAKTAGRAPSGTRSKADRAERDTMLPAI